MKWSWKIARLWGVNVYVHVTFLILLAWVGISAYQVRQSWVDVGTGILFIFALFGIVVLHEYGHALTARRYGIQTRDITLLPIGGVARLERMPDDPRQEFLVALAGPAVNVALAAAFFISLTLMRQSGTWQEVSVAGGNFLNKLFWINVFLAGFNMLPAFPMDGGRVLRALLAMRMDYVRATRVAATIGQAMAFLFGFVGLFYNPFLVFIALFVWMGAAAESNAVQMRSALGGLPLHHAMIRDFRTLSPSDPLRRAIDHILAGFQQDFPVLEDGRVVGVLTRSNLIKALSQQGQNGLVSEFMMPLKETAEEDELLENAFARLQKCDCHAIPVMRNGSLVGLLTMDNVGEFLMIQSALRNRLAKSFAE